MQPLVKNPNVTLEQLIDELNNPTSLHGPGLGGRPQPRARRARPAEPEADARAAPRRPPGRRSTPSCKERLGELEQQWGVPPAHVASAPARTRAERRGRLHEASTRAADAAGGRAAAHGHDLHAHPVAATPTSWSHASRAGAPTPGPRTIWTASAASCASRSTSRLRWPSSSTRPRDLTREQLREVKSAARRATATARPTSRPPGATAATQDIAASIIGFIRQAALGEPLVPFEQRVAQCDAARLAHRSPGHPSSASGLTASPSN